MSRIATFILARAGSRRIPKKNIVDFHGKPLIMWTVETAIAMGFPVYVFTDMPEIKELLEDRPVSVMPKLFENESGIHETGKELAAYNEQVKADHIILLQPTSPLRNVLKIIGWIEEYIEGGYSAGVACKKLDRKFYYIDGNPAYDIGGRNYCSNTIRPIYKETGSFYIFRKEQILENHFLNTKNLVIFEDPHDIDINTMGDLRNG